MIDTRPCSKNSTWFNGRNRWYCGTHNHEMHHEDYQCQLGQLESVMVAQLTPLLHSYEHRLKTLEAHFTTALKTFAANLEKLHEPPTGQD